jgi:hypothetical protein
VKKEEGLNFILLKSDAYNILLERGFGLDRAREIRIPSTLRVDTAAAIDVAICC